jgi:hypothetical protein
MLLPVTVHGFSLSRFTVYGSRPRMPKTPHPAQEFFSRIFFLEKVMALEENGGAFEFVGAPGRVCGGGRFGLGGTSFPFAPRRPSLTRNDRQEHLAL